MRLEFKNSTNDFTVVVVPNTEEWKICQSVAFENTLTTIQARIDELETATNS